MNTDITDRSRRFYEAFVAPLISERFPEYTERIAVGIAGEGSDCFGYDDLISRDHDFGTGVCLWLTDSDFARIGSPLSIAYNELAERHGASELTARLRERRGVMTIHDFYSNILGVDCDTDHNAMTDAQWLSLDHSCLATAVNGQVFRDDLGEFSAYRRLLLDYYPDRIWKWRIVNELHRYAMALQVNYARCMTRRDIVAAELCRAQGIEAAMQLYFLMRRKYPPYYKWTYRALTEDDETGTFAELIRTLAETGAEPAAWETRSYDPDRLNLDDKVVRLAEMTAAAVVGMMNENGLTKGSDPWLERYVDELQRDVQR